MKLGYVSDTTQALSTAGVAEATGSAWPYPFVIRALA
jgi:hypothetical protein